MTDVFVPSQPTEHPPVDGWSAAELTEEEMAHDGVIADDPASTVHEAREVD